MKLSVTQTSGTPGVGGLYLCFPPCSAGSSEELDIRAVGCPTHFRFTTACFTNMGTKSRKGLGSTPGYSPACQLPVPRILRCSPESAPPGHLPAVRPFAAPCRRSVDTAGPPTLIRIGQCAELGRRGPASSPGPLITRRRALPGPEPTLGVAVRALGGR